MSISHNGVVSGGTTTSSTPSTSTHVVPPPPFNPITEFFLRLKKNYQGGEDVEVEESSKV